MVTLPSSSEWKFLGPVRDPLGPRRRGALCLLYHHRQVDRYLLLVGDHYRLCPLSQGRRLRSLARFHWARIVEVLIDEDLYESLHVDEKAAALLNGVLSSV